MQSKMKNHKKKSKGKNRATRKQPSNTFAKTSTQEPTEEELETNFEIVAAKVKKCKKQQKQFDKKFKTVLLSSEIIKDSINSINDMNRHKNYSKEDIQGFLDLTLIQFCKFQENSHSIDRILTCHLSHASTRKQYNLELRKEVRKLMATLIESCNKTYGIITNFRNGNRTIKTPTAPSDHDKKEMISNLIELAKKITINDDDFNLSGEMIRAIYGD